jgi:hypothetical protein
MKNRNLTFEVVTQPPQRPPVEAIQGRVDVIGSDFYVLGQVVDVYKGDDIVASWTEVWAKWRHFKSEDYLGGFTLDFGTPGAIIRSNVIDVIPVTDPDNSLLDPRLPVSVVRALCADSSHRTYHLAGPSLAGVEEVTVARQAGTMQLEAARITNRSAEWLTVYDALIGVSSAGQVGEVPPTSMIDFTTTTPVIVRNPSASPVIATVGALCYVAV